MKHKKGSIVKEAKDSENGKLKRQIANLKKENKILRAENKTLNSYKEITDSYINRNLDGLPVEQVIEGVKRKQKIKSVKTEKEVNTKEACQLCSAGVIQEVAYPGGKIRICDNIRCKYREVVK